MSHAEAIQKNNDVLQRCTTINLYVIDFLGAKEVLDEAQESDLKAERSHLRQRILLFQWLKVVPSHKYESFLQVMKEAEQEHVANLLTGSTEDDHLPLSDARYVRLRKIRHKMAEVTQIDIELIAELRSSKTISMTDAEEIRAETVDYAKTSKLISAIMRRSNYSYNSFQEVLRKTLQTAAAEYLNEGEMPAVHINNNRPDLDGPLSLALNGVIRNRTTDDAEINDRLAEINGLGLNPANAKPGQSIVIFIYCKTVHNAVKFTQLFNSGRLQYILESILNRLLLTIEPHNTDELDSRISLEDEEIISLEEFTGIEDLMAESLHGLKRFVKKYSHDAATQTVFTDRNEDYFYPKRKLEQTPKENDKRIKLLEHQTLIDEPSEKYKSDPILVQAIRTKAAEEKNKLVQGLAILDEELFVVSHESSEVEVYDSIKFSFSRRWNFKELIRPLGIGSCNRNKCLYIFDMKGVGQSKEILRVDPNAKLIKKWSTGDDNGWGLSVTDESNVILTVYWKNKLNEYTPDGQLIREINLSSDACIRHPLHAIKLASGHFVVSHGIRRNDLHRVCVVDADGKRKKSFGWKCGSTTIRQMNHPCYLSVDGNGFVMVVDRFNCRVLLLDPDLEFKREILSKGKQGLRNPTRILMDETNGRLFVADNKPNNQQISIFQL